LGIAIFAGGKFVGLRKEPYLLCGTQVWLALVLLFCAPTAKGQGAAPETAPLLLQATFGTFRVQAD
jgi:hypothetical protein